jgi:ADP-ribose pyrophosphatase
MKSEKRSLRRAFSCLIHLREQNGASKSNLPNLPMIKDWTQLSSEITGDYRIFSVHRNRALSPRTGKEGEFFTIESSSWVNVIPITAAKEVVMIRQYRHGINGVSLEIPGGIVDEPDPRDAAIRELAEETGYVGNPVTLLGSVSPNPALFNNRCYSYLVENAAKTKPLSLDESEDIEVDLIPLDRIPALIKNGSIDHALVIAAFHFYFNGHS